MMVGIWILKAPMTFMFVPLQEAIHSVPGI